MHGMITFIREQFWHVAPILASGVLAIAILLERTRALFWVYPLHGKLEFYERIRALVMSDRLRDAVAVCHQIEHKPVAQIVREGLLRAHQPEEMVMDGIQIAVNELGQSIQQRTAYLATIANVATLLGLFGTIAGLIASFEAVGKANAAEKAALLAAGISTAMNATMLGLGVAIPCMIAFSVLMNRTNRLSAELDIAAMRTMDLLRNRFYGTDQQNAPVNRHAS